MGPDWFPSTCVPSAVPESRLPMLGQGLPGNGATGCCAVHLSPIVTVLFCLVCALDCVTGEVRRSNQALSNGLWAPAGGKAEALLAEGREGDGTGRRGRDRERRTLPGASQAPPGWLQGRQRSLDPLGENLGQG